MIRIRLYIKDNYSFEDNETGFNYLDSFAKTLLWLYSDEANGSRTQSYNVDGIIKLYQLVNVILLLVSHAKAEFGEATVRDFIHDMERGEGNEWCDHSNVVYDFTNKKGENGLAIKWASRELIMCIMWGSYIYCKAMAKLDNTEWQHAEDVIYKVFKDISYLSPAAFERNWLIKHTDEMVKNLLSNISNRKKEKKKKKAKESVDKIETRDDKVRIAELEAQVKKLEAENVQLKEESKEKVPANAFEKIIFFATVLSAAYSSSFTNQQELAKFICLICGGKTSTFQPRISKLSTMALTDNYTKEVINAAKKIVERLKEVPKGDDKGNPQIQKIIKSIEDEFNLRKYK